MAGPDLKGKTMTKAMNIKPIKVLIEAFDNVLKRHDDLIRDTETLRADWKAWFAQFPGHTQKGNKNQIACSKAFREGCAPGMKPNTITKRLQRIKHFVAHGTFQTMADKAGHANAKVKAAKGKDALAKEVAAVSASASVKGGSSVIPGPVMQANEEGVESPRVVEATAQGVFAKAANNCAHALALIRAMRTTIPSDHHLILQADAYACLLKDIAHGNVTVDDASDMLRKLATRFSK
jgi:hypothetical protein